MKERRRAPPITQAERELLDVLNGGVSPSSPSGVASPTGQGSNSTTSKARLPASPDFAMSPPLIHVSPTL